MPKESNINTNPAPLTCGLIMPISAIEGMGADHWVEVKTIIQDAVASIEPFKFVTKLVSEADDVGVIHKRIVHGIYTSDIVVCDVSARNANVMFELGMRLAFDKPTIIIKDDKTDYAFDTSIIEHLAYPRDLRFAKIVNFKRLLAEKIIATHTAATKDPTHSTFLKNFGTYKVAELNQTVGSGEQVMIEMLTDMQKELARLRRWNVPNTSSVKSDEARARIISELMQMKMENPSLDFSSTETISSILETLLPAHNYFNNKREFLRAVSEVCADLHTHYSER